MTGSERLDEAPVPFLGAFGAAWDAAMVARSTLREKLIKICARIVRTAATVVFQLAEVAVPRAPFAEILRRVDQLRPKPTLLAA